MMKFFRLGIRSLFWIVICFIRVEDFGAFGVMILVLGSLRLLFLGLMLYVVVLVRELW